ncbi:16S rRNA (guanine(966)-N(2))-methyltransferase RsmD [Corynebacterium uberis]|uniref:16S rRNA (guanine(966)-N(2))-methyltransferase RsmD n=1 Tax=Corynebacterium TaxID=1716 RepID=UPI001D0B165D|nr:MULTISPECIES: 16S rRNA (guanine(966)-N(2))-methyltransferase RsmD [Corynebacterium]MCZ9309138.1 16S rRNA (guanine(966)-N(2))-methyltransferase RsmD [Corynebacterium sp. c6VSa_13]UDL74400.1 16S rRNA (guanine(966)-N(2))-methyltransferase RsmD [Corynebacterium uberis]UDL76766.1 16S rRNA (guanine(966)-N(2))-methyltransferase RsmD [Corynebacterium uberis]UDL78979.1 16S rRNA (guanine(966)-N(2))-methyltransferase RsmD [Corynebacterium uberis]UDL81256.1 16S rRNA (guanine(966)-N(2))-methyltransferas
MARIISGHARGRKLKVPPEGTRPTSDRAKEGLFSSLQVRFGFEGRTVLDLFAGSGALGLEALSRGAQSVVLVDAARAATAIIRHNAHTVGLPGVTIEEAVASTYVARAPHNHFDMVLADPPYDLDDTAIAEMVRALIPTLRPGAVVVIERHKDSAPTDWPDTLVPTTQKLKKRTYGIARMDMAVYTPEEAEQ